jgi:selenocysteine-specific elongation factor
MILQHRILATAGHIDHGKSTLVQVLTGTNPDRLPEEMKRGMTIELGFAHLDLPDGETSWQVGMVDVPGHADFVRNMVAGVGSIDAAVLIVAADDGWMPQTEEHFQILLHLGVKHGVVALTKRDMAVNLEACVTEVRGQLAETPWAEADIVPVSAPQGAGMDELRASLIRLLRRTPPCSDTGKPRLFVDRVFIPRGAGTVVTGTLTGGSLKIGDRVQVQPGNLTARIRGLQNHHRHLEMAQPGMRTAIQLAGVEAARDGEGEGVWRGHVVEGGDIAAPPASTLVHVWLNRLTRGGGAADGEPPIKNGQEVWVHHGAAGCRARVYLPQRRPLAPGDSGIAELRFQEPPALLGGDRFILRDIARRCTLAGGTALDAEAKARAWKRPGMMRSLEIRAAEPHSASAWVQDLFSRDGWLKLPGLLVRTRFAASEIAGAVKQVNAVERGPWLITEEAWQGAKSAAAAAVRDYHTARPNDPGMEAADLRKMLLSRLPDAPLADALVEELTAAGGEFVRERTTVRAVNFKGALNPELHRACEALRAAVNGDRFNPPSISTYITSPPLRAALTHLQKTGEVFYLTPEIAMQTAAAAELRDKILAFLKDKGRATMSEIREACGLSRRILVPFCERMDREGHTVRHGDFRVVRQKFSAGAK